MRDLLPYLVTLESMIFSFYASLCIKCPEVLQFSTGVSSLEYEKMREGLAEKEGHLICGRDMYHFNLPS